MPDQEELNSSINQLKTSSEVLESLLGEVLDQLKKNDEESKKNAEEFKLSDFKTNLKKLTESINRNDLLRKSIIAISNKIDSINNSPSPLSDNSLVLGAISSLRSYISELEKNKIKQNSTKGVTIFGGNNAALNYQRIIVGFGIVLILYFGFKFLPNYFLQNQELNDQYQLLKTYAEAEKMYEFYKKGNTDEFDSVIKSISTSDKIFLDYYNELKVHWNREHEKAALEKQIKEQQEKLKNLKK